jgi:hypothetical protein
MENNVNLDIYGINFLFFPKATFLPNRTLHHQANLNGSYWGTNHCQSWSCILLRPSDIFCLVLRRYYFFIDILLVGIRSKYSIVQLGEIIQIISPIIYGSALIVSILQFSAMKKSMFSQSVQQTYTTTTQEILFLS